MEDSLMLLAFIAESSKLFFKISDDDETAYGMVFNKFSWMNCMLISSKIKSFSLNPILISDPKKSELVLLSRLLLVF